MIFMGMNKQEKEWQAQEDARTLARAEEIKNDSSRKKAAIKEARKIVKEKEKEVKAIKKIAK